LNVEGNYYESYETSYKFKSLKLLMTRLEPIFEKVL